LISTLKNQNYIILSVEDKLYYHDLKEKNKNLFQIKNYNKKKILCIKYYSSKNKDYLITSSTDNLIIIYDIEESFQKINIIENIGNNCDENKNFLLYSFTQFELNNINYFLTTCYNDNFINFINFEGKNKEIFYHYNNVKQIEVYYCNINYIFYVIILGENNVLSINFDNKDIINVFSKKNNNMIINNFNIMENNNEKIFIIESLECGNLMIYDFLSGNLLKIIKICDKINMFVIVNYDYSFVAGDDSILYLININTEERIEFPLKNSIMKIDKFIIKKMDNIAYSENIAVMDNKKNFFLWESIDLETYIKMKQSNIK
jgi:WD40 repeat protein